MERIGVVVISCMTSELVLDEKSDVWVACETVRRAGLGECEAELGVLRALGRAHPAGGHLRGKASLVGVSINDAILQLTITPAIKLLPTRYLPVLARCPAPLRLPTRPSHPSLRHMLTPATPPIYRPPKPPLVAIIGTTGVGKSQLGIDLARWMADAPVHSGRGLSGAEVINADSMQVYKGLDVITNKVTEEEKQGVPHHLMGFLEPGEEYKVGDFQRDAIAKVSVVVAGGEQRAVRPAVGPSGPHCPMSELYSEHRS